MSPSGPAARSHASQGEGSILPSTAPQPNPPESPNQKVTSLIQRLDDLFLSDNAEAFRELWEELKTEIGTHHTPTQPTIDNTLVLNLIEAVADLVKKQKPTNDPSRLSRELVVRNPEATPEDRSRPINQMVEEINRTKSTEIKGRVLAARRLPSGDITITADSKETKELLERDGSWLAAVGQAAHVNRRKFPVMVHGMPP